MSPQDEHRLIQLSAQEQNALERYEVALMGKEMKTTKHDWHIALAKLAGHVARAL